MDEAAERGEGAPGRDPIDEVELERLTDVVEVVLRA